MSAVTGSAVRLRDARFEDHAAIAALEDGGGLKSRSADDWRRLWSENPAYREIGGDWPIGWVLETSGGEIAGALSNIPLHYEFRGRRLLAAAGRGWTVADAYRSYALMLMDRYFDQAHVDLFLNTTVNAQAAQAFGVFGSRPVPAGDWGEAAYRITNYAGFAQSALRIKGAHGANILRYPLAAGLWAREKLQRPRRPRGGSDGIRIAVAHAFDERFDPFWSRLRAQSRKLLGVRTRATLDWHFSTGAWIVTASRDGELRAYAVFQRKDEPRYALRRMRLVDFQALERPQEHGRLIMERAARECHTRGIETLEQVGTGIEPRRWFEAEATYRRKLPHWCFYYSAPEPGLAAELAHAEAWEPSSFDGDASL